MNQLSMLLYWGNVVSNFGIFLVIFGVLALFFSIAYLIHSFYAESEMCEYEKDEVLPRVKKERRRSFVGLVGAFHFFLLAAFVPTKETIYAVAASEMGETALKSETGSLVTKALNAWLKKQLTEEPAPTTDKD